MGEKGFELKRDVLDHTLIGLVSPDQQKLLTCIQCGTCTASCPTAYAMDYIPPTSSAAGDLSPTPEWVTSFRFTGAGLARYSACSRYNIWENTPGITST
ncbi:MAG: hypothetical protein C4555_02475 [Dehalococcoidia bacterium]|jgi:ferredoxin|nr:MAG: hypothetical protein C4555_02475 [Dehalococcoidia bacterium]